MKDYPKYDNVRYDDSTWDAQPYNEKWEIRERIKLVIDAETRKAAHKYMEEELGYNTPVRVLARILSGESADKKGVLNFIIDVLKSRRRAELIKQINIINTL